MSFLGPIIWSRACLSTPILFFVLLSYLPPRNVPRFLFKTKSYFVSSCISKKNFQFGKIWCPSNLLQTFFARLFFGGLDPPCIFSGHLPHPHLTGGRSRDGYMCYKESTSSGPFVTPSPTLPYMDFSHFYVGVKKRDTLAPQSEKKVWEMFLCEIVRLFFQTAAGPKDAWMEGKKQDQ